MVRPAQRRRPGAGQAPILPWWIGAPLAAVLLLSGLVFVREQLANREQAQRAQRVPRSYTGKEYVSSSACRSCHPSEHASWHRSYHRTMTQRPGPDTVVGDFSDQLVTARGENIRLRRTGDDFFFETLGADGTARQKRVALTTGSHHQQIYWTENEKGNAMAPLPLVFLREDQRWVSVMDIFINDPAMPPWKLPSWNLICIRCHATGAEPRMGIDTRVAELGISCEACHGPGAQHIRLNRAPWRRYSLYGDRADPTIVNPARVAAPVASEICGACHGVRWLQNFDDWNRHGFRFRPGDRDNPTNPLVRPRVPGEPPWLKAALERDAPHMSENQFWPDGMVRVSGREYSGVIESPCFKGGQFSCLSCHSLHDSEPDDQLRRESADAACLRCHKKLASAVPAHSHHQASSEGSRCVNCHMPYTTYGLLKSIRSHQISSPTVKESSELGRPNACNLCHLDRTLEWTSQALTKWYGSPAMPLAEDDRQTAASILWMLKGDAGQRALVADAMGRASAREASGSDWMAPYLAQLLVDPYSPVRYIAFRSLRQLPGYASLAFDFVAPLPELEQGRRRALAMFRLPAGLRPELLGSAQGLDIAAFERLLRQRNDRPMNLKE